jgi:PPOX class probable F420-dependent enzyme
VQVVEIADVITPVQEHAFEVGKRITVAGLRDLPEVHLRLLEAPVTAVLGTVNPGGTAQLTPVWCNHDGRYINLNSVKGRLKDRNLRKQSRVTLLLMNPENPYHWLTIYGHVVRIIEEDDEVDGHLATENIDVLAEVYLGKQPYPLRDPRGEVRVLYKVEPTRIVTFGPVTA